MRLLLLVPLCVACHREPPAAPRALAVTRHAHPVASVDPVAEAEHQAAVLAIIEKNRERQLEKREGEREAIAKRDADAAEYRKNLNAEWAAKRIDGVRKLSPENREKKLRACYAATRTGNCSQLAVDIYSVTEGAERERMASLAAQLLKARAAQWGDPSTDPLFCCDGSQSDSCVVGSKLSGCCLEHGGPCGYGLEN